MNIKALSAFITAAVFASFAYGSGLQARLEQEMAAIRAIQNDPFDKRECSYSQKNWAVLSCPFGKIEKQRLSATLSAAGWKYTGTKELRIWFVHVGETLEFQKGKLVLGLDLYDSETHSNVETLSTK